MRRKACHSRVICTALELFFTKLSPDKIRLKIVNLGLKVIIFRGRPIFINTVSLVFSRSTFVFNSEQ